MRQGVRREVGTWQMGGRPGISLLYLASVVTRFTHWKGGTHLHKWGVFESDNDTVVSLLLLWFSTHRHGLMLALRYPTPV